ncbi:MAG: polysaccharide deacetylase [Actinobacteria bacterium]|nr:polysaccharide deacetylase [Actinomycetota bacterium]
MSNESEPVFDWPAGKLAAVCLTFDVDAESGFIGDDASYARRLTSLSEGRYGVTRGLPRLLELLGSMAIPATFFVPGDTADRHPQVVADILEAGHEIGHHGHRHLRSDLIGEREQREEIELGLAALERAGAPRPRGYRSSSWELTPETFALLGEHGFEYDSSCMGDDRPYFEYWDGQRLLELPVHWSLDDWPHFGWSIDRGGNLTSADQLLETWRSEYATARDERRSLVLTMHPEVIGRPYRLNRVLRRLLEEIDADGSAWFARLDELAANVTPILGSAAA